MGLITAMLLPMPIHIGIDNSTVVQNFHKLQKFAEEQLSVGGALRSGLHPLRKPWQLVTDGDLWKVAWNILMQRGTTTVKVTKVKGHATEQHVEEGHVEL